MPATAEDFARKAREVFGSLENLAQLILAQREQTHERASLRAWMNDNRKQEYYAQSLSWALKALKGRLPAGQNWVVPGGDI
jgi:hypothetical protein